MRINRYQKEPAVKFFWNENKAEIHASDARIYGPVRWLSGESTCFHTDNLSLMPGIHMVEGETWLQCVVLVACALN